MQHKQMMTVQRQYYSSLYSLFVYTYIFNIYYVWITTEYCGVNTTE